MNLRTATAVAMVGALAVVGVGCGKKAGEAIAEKMMERAIAKSGGGKAKVDLSEGGVKVTTEKGEVTASYGEGAAVPKDFPADVPIYSGAKVVSAVSTPEGTMVTLSSKDAVQKIVDSYEAALADKGWKREAMFDGGGQKTLSFKKETRTATLMVAKDDAGSTIAVTVAKER